MIGYGKQSIGKDDIKSVVRTLNSSNLTQGNEVTNFEYDLSKYFGVKYVSVVSNGTAALHLTALALGWKKDDVIITTPITFLSSATVAYLVGAKIDLVDIDFKNYNLDPILLETKLKIFKKKGQKIKAVIAVDYAGHPCDWKSLRKLADKYKFVLINDNCHAMGAEYNNSKKYAGRYADIVTQSYHPVKNFTTGEGGAVLTNSKAVDKKIKLLRSHNMIKNHITSRTGPWLYHINEIGFNYRLTDIQCALGITQLKKLNNFVKKRQSLASKYDYAFINDERFIIPKINLMKSRHAYHLYPIQIKFENLKISKKKFFYKMLEKGINLQVHYFPIHLQPFFLGKIIHKKNEFQNAERFYNREVSLPIFPELKINDQLKIIHLTKKLLE